MPFTRAEMVTKAAELGFVTVSQRLVTDWAQLGLLAHPQRVARPAGQGRGALYQWSDQQFALFCNLLHHRRRSKDIQRLLNLPVSVWVYWDGDWGVDLTQVRRAMSTWSTTQQNNAATEDRATAQARLVVNTLAAPTASREAKRRLREELLDTLRNRQWNQERISPLARAVADPETAGRRVGPFATSTEFIVSRMGAMLRGLELLPHASDQEMINARDQQRDLALGYIRDWATNVTDPDFGKMFEEPSLEFFVNRACQDLVRHLGMLDLAGGGLPPTQGPWTNLPQILREHGHAAIRPPREEAGDAPTSD